MGPYIHFNMNLCNWKFHTRAKTVHHADFAHVQVGHVNLPCWPTGSCLFWKLPILLKTYPRLLVFATKEAVNVNLNKRILTQPPCSAIQFVRRLLTNPIIATSTTFVISGQFFFIKSPSVMAPLRSCFSETTSALSTTHILHKLSTLSLKTVIT